MFRVCTYPDPFTINTNKQLWELMTNNPQFCASQTLVQGMDRYYKKNSFYFIKTVQSLIDNIYGEWTKNFDSDINLYLAVSNYIKTIKNETLKSSLKNNISDIVKSIKLLIVMRADKDMFNEEVLSFEQKEILKIYEHISSTKIGKNFEKYDGLTQNDLNKALRKCLLDDINNYIEREEINSVEKVNTLAEAEVNLEKMKLIFDEKRKSDNFFDLTYGNINYKDKINEVDHYIYLIKSKFKTDTLVFHGIHKITPIMYFLFKTLDHIGINVIFVINYMKNYPVMCETWNKVYAWTKCKFEYVQDLVSMYNDLGKNFGKMFERNFVPKNIPDISISKFSNLTQFTDEISEVYETSKTNSTKSSSVLSNMKVQYYAIDSDDSNKILKIYYPEQFGSKHFLTYPIGQFILNIYNMWDTKLKKFIYKFSNLYECINSGLLLQDNTAKVYNICKKLELYFGEEFDMDDLIERANSLKENINYINKNKDLKMLNRISFYSLSEKDVDLFVNYVKQLNDIGILLFKEESVRYKSHFKKLMDIVSSMVKQDSHVSKIELDLVQEIKNKLQVDTTDDIEGSIDDIQQAIFYYLSAVEDTDSSNWIVRGFDQIDGGVLLSKSSKAKAYHFALLSNNHLCGAKLQDLPYPLTIEMFKAYEDSDSCINVINQCYKEQRNYLRFYLFYALMFTQKNIELSFVETEKEGEEQDVYYAFKALGLNVIDREDNLNPKLSMEKEDINSNVDFSLSNVTYEDKEIFSICPYKFFLTSVLKDNITYISDYHVKYFVNNFMLIYFINKYAGMDFDSVIAEIKAEMKHLQKLFPFWLNSEYRDITNKLINDIQKFNIDTDTNKILRYKEKYKTRKENFLIAQWVERDRNGEPISGKLMRYIEDVGLNNINNELIQYMNSDSTHNFEVRKQFPHPKICENCNYVEVCLRKYYEVLEDEYNDTSNNGDEY